jgi:hypothetical protein
MTAKHSNLPMFSKVYLLGCEITGHSMREAWACLGVKELGGEVPCGDLHPILLAARCLNTFLCHPTNPRIRLDRSLASELMPWFTTMFTI